ncbi:MAG: 5-oxoprolinase subunit PxpB [Synergistaceae bacterium]|nr:5-oxoprolinase subunit PxpB [Synergistaceae bacterium]
MEYKIAGDSTLLVRFGDSIDEEVGKKVRRARLALEEEKIEGIVELVPTYCSLYIFYNPFIVKTSELISRLEAVTSKAMEMALPEPRIVDVPVAYGGEYGPDLDELAQIHGLTREDVIKRHASKEYLVYMLGFTPGFTFCGSVDDDIATPRRKDPRLKILPGSVGIAGKQTGLYAVSSPGGWQLIGRTYMRFYNPDSPQPTPVRAGDYLRFVPIAPDVFEANRAEIDAVDTPSDYSDWRPGGVEIFETVVPGALTTVQDLGRYGYQELGISCSGAMDEISFRVANRLIGNGDNAPALEITMMGPKLKALGEALIAVTGADLSLTVNGSPAAMYRAIKISAGDVISFGQPVSGMRAYLAVTGGVSVPVVMGSSSTGLNARIGGFKGRKLIAGDVLNRVNAKIPESFIGCRVDPKELYFGADDETFRVIPGPETEHFTPEGVRTFYSSEYTLGENTDRMGARLEGPVIEHNGKGPNIISDGVTLGSVQVPGEGYPLVLLKDRQAVGGYAKIGTICTADAFRMGQKRPKDRVRFKEITLEEGQEILRRMEYVISGIGARELFIERSGAKDVELLRVTVEDKSFNVFVEKK